MAITRTPEQVRDPNNIGDKEFKMPSPESDHRLRRFMDASRIANSYEFAGLVLMSLCFYVEDHVWEEALQDALRTVVELEVEAGGTKAMGRA